MNRNSMMAEALGHGGTWDLIVVGGGATGLGTAVDAAQRGLRTLLVEQSDLSKGTSSRSTKLVHGGVRYLRQGNVSLVLEALKERGLMRQNAPHLVHDQEFIIPGYRTGDVAFYGIGMKVYEAMAGKLSFGRSHMISLQETVARIPTIEPHRLRGGVVYHDGQFDDSRLAVNLAQTAADLGGCILNYVKCVGLIKENGRTAGILARDMLGGREFELRGRAVVNATGVFVDDLLGYDVPEHKAIVAVSQGIHFVLPKEFLPGTSALMVPKTDDGRVLFAIPWHDHVVIGTTDTAIGGKSLEPRALPAERDFVMSHACKYLAKDPADADVLSVFAGLRPLVRAGHVKSTSKLSREHTILVGESGLVTVTGGKWTTYRKMAEDVVNQVLRVAGLGDRPCGTTALRIHGWTTAEADGTSLSLYGSDAAAVRSLCDTVPGMAEPLHPRFPYLKGEVLWQARNELAMTVEDVLARRTRALLLNARASVEAAPLVANLLAAEHGHDEGWIADQVRNYSELARSYIYTDPASTGSN